MSVYKYIYWRPDIPEKDGMQYANIHLLQGYTEETVSAYEKLADRLKELFPGATYDNVVCGKIRESQVCKNFSIVAYNTYLPKGAYPGWFQTTRPPEYGW